MKHRLSVFLFMFALCACVDKNKKEDPKPTADAIEVPSQWPSPESRRARDLTPTASETEQVLLRGATILTATGERIEGGDLLLLDGKIAAISKTALEAKEGVTIIDVSGKFITPGLIDTHSHLGVYPTPNVEAHSDGNEATSPTTPDVNAEHSVWPQDPGFQRALAGGVTALQILPGSANLIGGRSATLQLHPGISSAAMRFPDAPGGVKMACGENPKRVYGGRGGKPSTRMGNMAVWRQTFQKAAETREAWDSYTEKLKKWSEDPNRQEDKKPKEPSLDLAQETLIGILRGDLLVRRSGETFLVEVKTGEREPSLRSSATRRQLLEYAHAFDVDGLLLVDATTGAVHEVRTPATRAARPRAGLGWVFAVVALGALGAWLVTRAG